jgi:hypothetical protein
MEQETIQPVEAPKGQYGQQAVMEDKKDNVEPCFVCGFATVKAGTCHLCPNCGTRNGCG